MNPVGIKIQKIKKSFKPELHNSVDSTYTDSRSQDTLYDSTSRFNNPPERLSKARPNNQTTDDENPKENALLQRIFNLQDRVERQERSNTFYLRELNRREHNHQEQLVQMERQHAERIECLQQLLQMEIDKNISLERQVSMQYRDNFSSLDSLRRNQLKRLSMGELSSLVDSVQEQLDSRKRRKEIEDRKSHRIACYRQEEGVTAGSTQDSALLSDYKEFTRHQ